MILSAHLRVLSTQAGPETFRVTLAHLWICRPGVARNQRLWHGTYSEMVHKILSACQTEAMQTAGAQGDVDTSLERNGRTASKRESIRGALT